MFTYFKNVKDSLDQIYLNKEQSFNRDLSDTWLQHGKCILKKWFIKATYIPERNCLGEFSHLKVWTGVKQGSSLFYIVYSWSSLFWLHTAV